MRLMELDSLAESCLVLRSIEIEICRPSSKRGRSSSEIATDLDHFSCVIDRQHRYLHRIVFLIMTAVFTLSGEALERYQGVVKEQESQSPRVR